MRDGPLRRVVKHLTRLHNEANQRVAHALLEARGDRPFDLSGACRRCGSCCEAPAIQTSRAVFHSRLARALFLGWQRVVNGFELVSRDRRTRTFVFRCTHYDAVASACDSYDSRPAMCRDYPRALLWQANPELFPTCGYRVVAADAERLLQVLRAQPMTDEQRAKLGRGLRLER